MSGPSRKPQVARRAAMDRGNSFLGYEGEYNIWYGRRTGSRNIEKRDSLIWKNVVPMMCVTKGERNSGSQAPYVCLFFARGKCDKGEDCDFLHRTPTAEDAMRLDAQHDVFGRERHSTDREDHGGVGSFMQDNRTLYVGRLAIQVPKLLDRLHEYFGLWGEVVSLRVIERKSICFVEYVHRAHAEFAKEVTGDQAILHPESSSAVNVRWGIETERQIAAREKRDRELFAEVHASKHGQVAEVHVTDEPQSKRAKENGEEGKQITLYPDTEAQYGGQAEAPPSEPPTADTNSAEYKEWYDRYMAYYYPNGVPADAPQTQQTQAASTVQTSESSAPSGGGNSAQDWAKEQERLQAWKDYYAQMGYSYDPQAYDAAGGDAAGDDNPEPLPPGVSAVKTPGKQAEEDARAGALGLVGGYASDTDK